MNLLHKAELEQLPEDRERFTVTNIEQANWALRKIAAAQAAMAEREALAQVEIERIKLWLEGETKSLKETVSFFESLLLEYHIAELAKDSKAKTIKLPHGILKMRKQQPEYVRDDDVVKEWAQANKPDVLVPQPPKLDWTSLKKSLQVSDGKAIDPETGEVVPGISIFDRPPKFTVEV